LLVFLISPIHGTGKTTIAKELKKVLNAKLISVGNIYREIARSLDFDIDSFLNFLNKNRNLLLSFETAIDKLIYYYLEGVSENIIVDSNLAPFYGLEGDTFIIIADLDIIAKRIFRKKRIGDKKFLNLESIKEELIERTLGDIKRYEFLAENLNDNFWKKIYARAARYHLSKILCS